MLWPPVLEWWYAMHSSVHVDYFHMFLFHRFYAHRAHLKTFTFAYHYSVWSTWKMALACRHRVCALALAHRTLPLIAGICGGQNVCLCVRHEFNCILKYPPHPCHHLHRLWTLESPKIVQHARARFVKQQVLSTICVNNGTPFRMLQLIQMYEYVVCAVRIVDEYWKKMHSRKQKISSDALKTLLCRWVSVVHGGIPRTIGRMRLWLWLLWCSAPQCLFKYILSMALYCVVILTQIWILLCKQWGIHIQIHCLTLLCRCTKLLCTFHHFAYLSKEKRKLRGTATRSGMMMIWNWVIRNWLLLDSGTDFI